MSQSITWARFLVVSTFLTLVVAFSLHASGQQDKKTGGGFATVDIAKISNDYKAREAAEADLQNLGARYRAQLARRQNYPLLSEDEQKQLDALYAKADQNDADKAKIKEIETKGQQSNADNQALRQKKDTELTDADKQKLKQYDDSIQKAQAAYAALNDDLEGKMRQASQAKQDELMTKVRASIARIAEQKGIAVVFNSEVAPYAGTDITQSVVTELNKSK